MGRYFNDKLIRVVINYGSVEVQRLRERRGRERREGGLEEREGGGEREGERGGREREREGGILIQCLNSMSHFLRI